jgi:hypothetical protein
VPAVLRQGQQAEGANCLRAIAAELHVRTIALSDGLESAFFDGLPATASRLL